MQLTEVDVYANCEYMKAEYVDRLANQMSRAGAEPSILYYLQYQIEVEY